MSEAMADMKMHSVRRFVKHDGELIVLLGLTYDGQAICVELEPQGNQMGVRVRIEAYGDEPLSNYLPQRVSVRLATLPQSVNPPYDPRALSESITNRGMDIEAYRRAPLR